jgi:hypothetical protein
MGLRFLVSVASPRHPPLPIRVPYSRAVRFPFGPRSSSQAIFKGQEVIQPDGGGCFGGTVALFPLETLVDLSDQAQNDPLVIVLGAGDDPALSG